MQVTTKMAALAASGMFPIIMAAPFGNAGRSASSVDSVSSAPEPSTYPYVPATSASQVPMMESFSVDFGTGSWSPFATSVSSSSASGSASASSSDDWDQSPASSSEVPPYGSIVPGPVPSFTVVVESFTVPIPHPSATATVAPSSLSSSPVSSLSVTSPTLSTVTATATVPFESGFTTIVHTFTITESAIISSSLAMPLPSASLSLDSSVVSKLSRSAKSASSLGSAMRSIFSDMDGSQSGVGPVIAPNSAVSTKPGQMKRPKSMITATFTLTLPTSTFFMPILPTHTGSMITAEFTLTLPAPSSSTAGPVSSTIDQSSGASETVTESCSTSSTLATSTSCETPSPPVPTGFPETLTLTLSTKVTLTINGTKTTSCSTETTPAVPSGSDAITVTYTLPGGPGRANQTLTLTTVRPTPQASSSGVSSSASASASLPSGPTAGPTGTGSIAFPPASSLRPSGVVPSPAFSGVIVVTETKTFTEVHTATGAATTAPNVHTTLAVGGPHHHNVTTFATGTGTGTSSGGARPTAHGPFANVTGTHVSEGAASPTHGIHVRDAECNRNPKGARIVLNFDDSVIQEESLLAPNTQGFANPDQGMQFSGGFERVVYSPNSRFVPSSMPGMLRFNLPPTIRHGIANGVAKIGTAESCSRFNLVSWNLGCDATDAPCRFNITGFRLAGGEEVATGSHVFVVPHATKTSGNTLHPVAFDTTDDFANLSSFTVDLEPENVAGGRDSMWWSDDLSVARVCDGSPFCAAIETSDKTIGEDSGKKAAPFWHH
ncbi:uncharacterized protein SPSK_01483 [Sporothrix schenckii 1099-18]|uniref:DUF7371 domain-containing protein n=1 Tax=Sporothrix schenckii 1099-18 TaxID=1397361 RepID=A0A0F2MFG0_SPOSC|nr:uncharacterized protein SPSK_01483 [Sporothrix schenckii 1099-18]KJR87570.1 hypothetical protein SPSK_01483 [Sporothrix schenckii 1099-18]